jgi:hypothetical protein
MTKLFMFLFGALFTFGQINAQSESKMDLTIHVNENTFKKYENGYCQIAMQLSPSADLVGMKKMVAENPQYFQIKTEGYNVTLGFSDKLPWAIWRKVFLQADIHVIEVVQSNQSQIVDVDGFMSMFGFENMNGSNKK